MKAIQLTGAWMVLLLRVYFLQNTLATRYSKEQYSTVIKDEDGEDFKGIISSRQIGGLFSVYKCHCEHADGWNPQNGIMCGREGNVERVSYCAEWETCTGTTEWSSGVDQSSISELCEAECYCENPNDSGAGKNGIKCGLNGNDVVVSYCGISETCTGTKTMSYSERATLCN